MSGGLIQLVAYGTQDLFITKDPEITFFKIVYRRYTNFSTEAIPQQFTTHPQFGKKITCKISKSGDLVGKMHLVVTLPNIPKFKDENNEVDHITKFAWVRRIGYAIIKNIEIEIGGELIDRQYGDWLNIWHELNITSSKNLDKILGNVEELIDFSNGKKCYKLFVPLRFWFNRFPGLSLPVIALKHSHIKINLEINDINKCCIIAPTHYIDIENDFVNFKQYEYIEQNINGVKSLARFIHFDILNRRLYLWRLTGNGFNGQSCKYPIYGLDSGFIAIPQIDMVEHVHINKSFNKKSIELKEVFLLVEYIYLDQEERIKFSESKHEYLIEQILYSGEKNIDSPHQSYRLGFNQTCKELQWVSQLNLAQKINDIFNYTNSLERYKNGKLVGDNIILKETIMFNGLERLSMRESDYFGVIQPYQNYSNSPETGINVYSFSLYPEKYQPSGSANLGKIDDVLLKISVSHKFENAAKIRIYGVAYNVFRITHGICGLLFDYNP